MDNDIVNRRKAPEDFLDKRPSRISISMAPSISTNGKPGWLRKTHPKKTRTRREAVINYLICQVHDPRYPLERHTVYHWEKYVLELSLAFNLRSERIKRVIGCR